MFVGRERELAALEKLYDKEGFQMAVVYGRRRVGKTALLERFARGKRCLYFTAQQKSTYLNLSLFSRAAYGFFDGPSTAGRFESWHDALSFVAEQAESTGDPLVFIFDEFPYAAEADESLGSVLQTLIDKRFKRTSTMMVLCGSNEGFMENEVLGRKSPLYGRRTAQMKIRPFDYLDASSMLPECDAETLVNYYATFGGNPYYLEQIEEGLSYEENVLNLFFDQSGLLYEEPLMLLRQELREPASYNSVLDAIGHGATRQKAIAERSGVDRNSLGKYLATLEALGIVRRSVPIGENPERSRRSIYDIVDPLFAFWYRFVSNNVGAIEAGAGFAAAKEALDGQVLNTYVGKQFENVCLQWLMRANASGSLPFLATAFGRWWGNDPVAREECDIDVVAANPQRSAAVFGECKWRESFDETKAFADLEARTRLAGDFKEKWCWLFSKKPLSAGTIKKVAEDARLASISVEEMFER